MKNKKDSKEMYSYNLIFILSFYIGLFVIQAHLESHIMVI